MAETTGIEWCDSTLNFWAGCTKVSPACDNCYAEAETRRYGYVEWGPHAQRRRTNPETWNKALKWERNHEAFFAAHLRRQRVFANSWSDVFDNQVPEEWREDLWATIAMTPNLDWLLLTKRPQNIANMLPVPFDFERLYPNVWLGTTVENQEEADRRIPHLLAVPAKVHFLSCEPLLGPVDLTRIAIDDNSVVYGAKAPAIALLDWIICGGESGPGARPMHPDWARSLRDQCKAASLPFLFKQWGEWKNGSDFADDAMVVTRDGRVFRQDRESVEAANRVEPIQHQCPTLMRRVGKKRAGRLLDGVTHDEFPQGSLL